MMQQTRTVSELRRALATERAAGKKIGFVATMGALHDGHLALMRAARAACDTVVVSIFVNPVQFDRKSDFATYPRDEAKDAEVAADAGVDLLFMPDAEEMYPDGYATYVTVDELSNFLCGAVRPGHFRGVATVVTKLLEIVRPDIAYFGEKDYQQLVVIERMVADLNMSVQIVGVPTVREKDGLAISSRNRLLAPAEREAAAVISSALFMVRDMVVKDGIGSDEVVGLVRRVLGEEPLVRIEYVNVVDPKTLKDVRSIEGKALVVVAAYLGNVRLIDNVTVGT